MQVSVRVISSALRVGILAWIAGDIDTFGYLALGAGYELRAAEREVI